MIEIIDKHTAKLIVNIGSGSTRKRRTRKVTYSGKRELNSMYREFEEECKRTPACKMTVKSLVDSYINHKKALGAKATTIRGYEIAENRINSRFERVSAHKLTAYQIEDFITEMSNKGLSAKTIINTVSLLNSAYTRAVRTGQLNENPCANVVLPKKKKPEILTFDSEEVMLFLNKLKSERADFRVGYSLCLFCGMRRSEVLGIRHSDINMIRKCVTINITRHRIDGDNDIIQDTKTARSARTLAIPDILLDDIANLIQSHIDSPYNDTDFLIQDGFGSPMSPSTFSNHIKRIEAEAELPPVSVHGLRHTFATMLNSEGIDIARISAELGHSAISTTTDKYTHVFGDVSASSRGIADAMNAKLSKSATFLPPEKKKKA